MSSNKLFRAAALKYCGEIICRSAPVPSTSIISSSSLKNRYQGSLLRSLNEPYESTDQNLNIENPYSADSLGERRKFLRDFSEQLNREKRGVVVVPSAYTNSEAKLTIHDHVWNEIQRDWRKQLTKSFDSRKDARYKIVDDRSRKINIGRYLRILDSKHYVDIMYDEAHQLSELTDYHGVPLKVLCTSLGRKLMARIQVELAEKEGLINKIADAYDFYSSYFLNWPKYQHLNHREFWQKITSELNDDPMNPNGNSDFNCTNDRLLLELGEFMYDILMDSVKIPLSIKTATTAFEKTKTLNGVHMVHAFYKAYSSHAIKKYSEIRAYKSLIVLKKKLARREIRFNTDELPMICPPIPWHKYGEGRMLIKPLEFVRLEPGGAKSLRKLDRLVTKGEDVNSVLDSLNVLGATPWMINKPVLDVMLQVFRGHGDMKLDIPPKQGRPLPPRPKGLSGDEAAKWTKDIRELKKSNAETYSLWCTVHYRFSLANYLKEKILWFPHNLDFRGRSYPVPPFLNHMGDDVCRGMMMFARGRPLGKDGLRLLKIHLINLTGLKKRDSLDERARYADEIMDDILDSARNPLNGKKWWTKSEDPWQTLAVCMEIEKALKLKRPQEYVCYVPIHQDGSCNGLQHYAALGRDQKGAEQVNLSPDKLPQDVYSAVAARIEQRRVKEAGEQRADPEQDMYGKVVALIEQERAKAEDANFDIARVLNGYIRRKVIKQTVMTTVYGVTKYGGRAQVMRQLKDIEGFPQEYAFRASLYLVERLFDAIKEIFTAASEIQEWFVKSADRISKDLNRTVEWATPLGFPVSQPYFKRVSSMDKPNTMKQKNAFPPNYIHSLDSTHMMLTALHCQRRGITYAAVHDSFWTHACSVSEMNEICREQFVALHSQPLLKDLSEFFLRHYVNHELSELRKTPSEEMDSQKRERLVKLEDIREHFKSVPTLGDFDLKAVKDSIYFFS